MSKFSQALLYIGVALLAVTGGVVYKVQQINHAQLSSTEKKEGAEAFFATSLPDIEGNPQSFSQWRGNVLLVNFWATWCAPCREEIPEFIEAQDKFREQGLVLVGIAIDQKERVEMFNKEFGINYPILVGDIDAFSLAEAMGNPQGALPYTVIINRDGEIVDSHLGRIHIEKVEKILKPLL
jgi:thiol-disulfide isomerase/thioredoxin